MWTIAIEALTPLYRTWSIKLYKISLDPGSFVEYLKGLLFTKLAKNNNHGKKSSRVSGLKSKSLASMKLSSRHIHKAIYRKISKSSPFDTSMICKIKVCLKHVNWSCVMFSSEIAPWNSNKELCLKSPWKSSKSDLMSICKQNF